MKSRALLFNGFLMLAVFALAAGCLSSEERKRSKEVSAVRIHMESDSQTDHSSSVSVIRAAPVRLNIEREPVLDERNVKTALVVEQTGGFAVELQFDRQGSWILERTTVMGKGRHMVIFGHFGTDRWLAAPEIRAKNSGGRLTFTPDCTREEAERFVRGLNNVTRKETSRETWMNMLEPIDK